MQYMFLIHCHDYWRTLQQKTTHSHPKRNHARHTKFIPLCYIPITTSQVVTKSQQGIYIPTSYTKLNSTTHSNDQAIVVNKLASLQTQLNKLDDNVNG